MKVKLEHLARIFAAVVLAMGAFSCRHGLSEPEGTLSVSVAPSAPGELIVKGGEAPAEDLVFSLSIDREDGTGHYEIADHRTLIGNPMTLPAGRYTISAVSGTGAKAMWDNPFYSGSTEVLVKPEQENTATVTCTLANTLVTVSFEDPIPELFTEYRVAVSNGGGDALVFGNKEGTLDGNAYFAVTGTLTWELNMVNADGVPYHLGPVSCSDVKANQHYHLKFSLGDPETAEGATTFTIIVDDSINTVTYELNLDFSGDLPGTSANFPLTNEITIPKGSELSRILSFKATRGIGSLVLQHDDAGLRKAGLPDWTDFVRSQDISGVIEAGVQASKVDFGALEASIDMTGLISSLEIGNYSFMTTVIDTRNAYDQRIFNLHVISPVDAEAESASAWARFALLTGRWYDSQEPAGLTFLYKKVSDTEWTEFDGLIRKDYENMTYTGELFGLEPLTDYVFMAVSAKDRETKQITFRTESAPTVPNLSFDSWYQSGSCWYPNASSSEYVWDSANPGTSSLGVVPTTPETSDLAVPGSGKKAARLESSTAFGQFAAGNIYIGQFDKVSGLGAELNWGYRFTGRPIALRGYYKYAPKNIDKTKAPYTGLAGQPDFCSIRVWLVDWSAQFHINTSKSLFLEDDDPSIIALGSLFSQNTDSEYVKFVIPIQYRDTDRTPTYIAMACAASRYGDYFTGGVGSVLLVDEFELIYDPSELTEEERELVNYR